MSDKHIHVVVPGTFDPVTFGHLDVIERASRLFERVTVAVAASEGKGGKGPVFSLEERVDMIQEALHERSLEGIDVLGFTGLLVEFCRELNADAVVKGLRASSDFEWELKQADLNAHLHPDLESIFVISNPQYGYISSSIVRELAQMGANVDFLVPNVVLERLKKHYLGT